MDRLSADVGSTDLAEYGARVRRRWRFVVGGVVLGLLAGWVFSALQAEEYTSTTSVLVLPTPDTLTSSAVGRTRTEVNLDTEAQLVRSARTAAAVREELDDAITLDEVRSGVTVTVPPNSQVLTIAFMAGTPELAQAGAAAYADTYLERRADAAETEISNEVDVLTAQLVSLRTELAEASNSAAALPADSPNRVIADAQRGILIGQITDVTNRLSPLQATTVVPGEIITEAPLPDSASSPLLPLNLAAGLMAGLLLGLAAALWADRADHTVRRPSDVDRQVGVPVLATISYVDREEGVAGAESAAAFDLLRNSVVGRGHGARVLCVSDLTDSGAADVTAMQLARSLALASHDVLLVVAHEGSSVPRRLGLSRGDGLAQLLQGGTSVGAAAQRSPALPGVRVLPPGRDAESLGERMQTRALESTMAELRAGGATVVLLTGPADTSAGAQTAAAQSDAVMLVVEQGATDARRLSHASDELAYMGSEVTGVVLAAPSGATRRRAHRSGQGSRGASPEHASRSGNRSGTTSIPGGATAAGDPSPRRDSGASTRGSDPIRR